MRCPLPRRVTAIHRHRNGCFRLLPETPEESGASLEVGEARAGAERGAMLCLCESLKAVMVFLRSLILSFPLPSSLLTPGLFLILAGRPNSRHVLVKKS